MKTNPSPTSSAVIAVQPYIQPYPHGKNKGVPKELPHIRAANGASYNELVVTPVLTPDRAEKRQHGRRFKEDGDPMFTLTGQDIHGVAILRQIRSDEAKEARRKNVEAGFDTTPWDKMEAAPREDGLSGSLTGVTKDNWLQKNMRIRRLTPVECERLQAFPDRFTEWGIDENGEKVKISDTQRYRALGNAVTTNVITFLGHKIMESLK